jgi:hypothetical protein
MNHEVAHDVHVCSSFDKLGHSVAFNETWGSKDTDQRAQRWVEPFEVTDLKDAATSRSNFDQFTCFRSSCGQGFFHQYVDSLGQEILRHGMVQLSRNGNTHTVNLIEEGVIVGKCLRVALGRDFCCASDIDIYYTDQRDVRLCSVLLGMEAA